MSIWAVNWALQTCVANPAHKLVLVALANYADGNDWAWPRVDTLAELTSSSRRTVFRALDGRLSGWRVLSRSGMARLGGCSRCGG